MPNIFNYMDYREFLKDFYNEKKAVTSDFSYKYIADKAGFKSKSFIKLVIDGRKNLTADSIPLLNRVLKLKKKAFSYFNDLVAFNQAKSLKIRNYYFSRLFSYRKRNPGRLVLQHQYDFYAKWHHNTIRELVTMYPFSEDYEALGRMVMPPISAARARESVQLLLKLQLIKKVESGYVQTSPLLTTGDEVKSIAVQNFHVRNMALGAQSIDICPASQRDISCMVLGLSAEGFEKVKAETQAFRKKVLAIALDDRKPDKVYHYNIQVFPTSQKIDGSRGRHV